MSKMNELIAAHPRLFSGRELGVRDCVPDGWHPLIMTLCDQIDAELNETEAGAFMFTGFKRAQDGESRVFASLGESSRAEIQLPGKGPSGKRPSGKRPSDTWYDDRAPGMKALLDLSDFIFAAEPASLRTCKVCGAPGIPAGRWPVGAIRTLCSRHPTRRRRHELGDPARTGDSVETDDVLHDDGAPLFAHLPHFVATQGRRRGSTRMWRGVQFGLAVALAARSA